MLNILSSIPESRDYAKLLLKFQDIKNLQISQFMFSISNNNLPIDVQDMFTLNNQSHSFNTRSNKFFHMSRTRTKLRQYSIKYQGPSIFSSLSNEIKKSILYSSFTKKLKLYLISTYS